MAWVGGKGEFESDSPLSNSGTSIAIVKVDEAMMEQKWAMDKKKTQTLVK